MHLQGPVWEAQCRADVSFLLASLQQLPMDPGKQAACLQSLEAVRQSRFAPLKRREAVSIAAQPLMQEPTVNGHSRGKGEQPGVGRGESPVATAEVDSKWGPSGVPEELWSSEPSPGSREEAAEAELAFREADAHADQLARVLSVEGPLPKLPAPPAPPAVKASQQEPGHEAGAPDTAALNDSNEARQDAESAFRLDSSENRDRTAATAIGDMLRSLEREPEL